jgi:FkbM family methyltransferase
VTIDSLSKIFDISPIVNIVDIGANPIDGDPPYKSLLSAGLARLIGFEPNPEALRELDRQKGPFESYLPYAIADGLRHTLHICQAPGMTSLLEPNTELLEYFHGFSEWGTVTSTSPIDTKRLDDINEIQDLDFLKIDIQGGELMAMQNAQEKLSTCIVIQTEVEFLPMYRDQPLFSEVDQFLRTQGFKVHKFQPLSSRALQPVILNDSVFENWGQVFWADAIFVRDFTQLHVLSESKLLRGALILNDVYGALDLASRFLLEHDRRTGGALAQRYFKTFGQ